MTHAGVATTKRARRCRQRHHRGGERQPHYDQKLKWMLSRGHDSFLAMIAPGFTWRGERSPELPTVARQADLEWEVEAPDGGRRLFSIELHVKVEDDIGERLAEYQIRLFRRDHLPIRSIVVYLRESVRLPAAPFVIPWSQSEDSLTCPYEVVRLWDVPQNRVLESTAYQLWPLAGLMAGMSEDSAVNVAERLAAAPVPRQERGNLISLLLTFASTRLPRVSLLESLRRHPMVDELVVELPRGSEMAAEFIDEGRRQMARIALEGRFGALGADVLAALDHAQEETLRDVVGHVSTDTVAQMRARLGQS